MRLPSVAVPHSIPPSAEPGPTAVLQTIAPVAASSAQYTPDFCPAPTIFRVLPFVLIVNRFTPAPKSASGPAPAGQLFGSPKPGMQPAFQLSNPTTPVDHRIAPVSM